MTFGYNAVPTGKQLPNFPGSVGNHLPVDRQ